MSGIKTHYDNLKVARNAPPEVIRSAYRALSSTYHPDKNPGNPQAVRVMKLINQAYDVLSDPVKRRRHDQWIERMEAANESSTVGKEHDLGATVKPRETQNPTRRNGKLKLVIPLLIFLAILGLYSLGSLQPSTDGGISAPALEDSGQVMARWNEIRSYPRFADLNKASRERARHLYFDDAVKKGLTEESARQQFFARASVEPKKPEAAGNGSISPAVGAVPPDLEGAVTAVEPDYSRAPNGAPWPKVASYVKGYSLLNSQGNSTITIDNSANSSNVYVKLVSLGRGEPQPVRHFFVPGFSSFTLNDVSSGEYDIRYRDLSDGSLSQSEAFKVDEYETGDGVRYSVLTITIYKVLNGNMETYPLSEEGFL